MLKGTELTMPMQNRISGSKKEAVAGRYYEVNMIILEPKGLQFDSRTWMSYKLINCYCQSEVLVTFLRAIVMSTMTLVADFVCLWKIT